MLLVDRSVRLRPWSGQHAHSDALDLRQDLRALWTGGGLAGAALVGNCPYILYEDGTRDFESDFLLGDLDCTLEDDLHDDDSYRRFVFDTWSGTGSEAGEMDVWICRIMARPSLVGFLNANSPPPGDSWTEQSILQRYFARNHDLRWKAFDARATALLFSGCESDCDEPLAEMQDVFGGRAIVHRVANPGQIDHTGWSPGDEYLDDLASEESYTHVYHYNFHGLQCLQFILDTAWPSPWYGYPYTYLVQREHYVVEGFHPGTQPEHPGCANPRTLTYVFETCTNGSFGYYPDDWDETKGACCDYITGCTEGKEDHFACLYHGGSFHAHCTECGAWSPEWPLPATDAGPCITEVAAFNPNSAGTGYENGAALTVLASRAFTDSFVYDMWRFYGALLDNGCLGDGMRELYNHHHEPPLPLTRRYVLLGDATLKVGLRWRGEPGDPIEPLWSIADNWTGGQAPDTAHPESLTHDNADEIQVDVGTTGSAFHLRRFFGDGAAGGGLRILADKHLEANEDVTLSAAYPITVEASAFDTTMFTVGGTLSGGNLGLMADTYLSAADLQDSAFTVLGGTLSVTGDCNASSFDATDADIDITGTAGGAGDWLIDGGQVSLGKLCAPDGPDGQAVQVELDDGAQLYLSEVPSGSAIQQPFPDGPGHKLLYGDGANSIQAGEPAPGGAFYVGDNTAIALAPDATSPSLSLDLYSSLSIASYFGTAEVRDQWNTTQVDVTLEAIPTGTQTLELISPDLRAFWPATWVYFADVACRGQFRTLTVPGATDAAPIYVVNDSNNWPDSNPEALYFDNISIGANRAMYFTTGAGLIYYSGDLDCQTTALYLDGALVPASSVFKKVWSSRYGDFNGDCILTNSEFADLQNAIQSGPYNPLYDADCDGVLAPGNDSPEITKFLYNYANQPPPECSGFLMAGGMDGATPFAGAAAEGVDDSEPVDTEGLAAWLADQLTPEQLAAFVADASATAAEHADDAVGEDMMELLSYLE